MAQSPLPSCARPAIAAKPLAIDPPPLGWICSVRRAAGISVIELSQRLGVTRQAVGKCEQAELKGSSTLKSLAVVADALDCDVAYAFVPRAGSFELQDEAPEETSTAGRASGS